MRTYLVRHGEAKHENVDPERHLTERGVAEVERIAAQVSRDLDVRPARVLHSGKARARQTAEIWGGLIGTEVAEADGLAPNDDPSVWAGRLGVDDDDVMLVGHLPHLERLVGLLVSGDAEQTVVSFPPAGFVCLERTEGGWELLATRR